VKCTCRRVCDLCEDVVLVLCRAHTRSLRPLAGERNPTTFCSGFLFQNGKNEILPTWGSSTWIAEKASSIGGRKGGLRTVCSSPFRARTLFLTRISSDLNLELSALGTQMSSRLSGEVDLLLTGSSAFTWLCAKKTDSRFNGHESLALNSLCRWKVFFSLRGSILTAPAKP
jgi:hypothetical protein